MRRLVIIFFVSILLVSCNSYKVRMNPKIDESKVSKLKVPFKNRVSFAHEEEDLSYICAPKQIVYVEFFNNIPLEVWCEK
ncbi:MAG: hypothetical protein SFU98_06805 [Leptospiraceae bacterium]|nr:hypothetical protein [Leptospiraceae bacterium]